MDGRPNRRNMTAFSNSSGSKSVFEKLLFQYGLVWTLGLAVEIWPRFQIPRAYCGQDLSWVSIVIFIPAVTTSPPGHGHAQVQPSGRISLFLPRRIS